MNFKKWLSLILAVAVALTVLPLSVAADETADIQIPTGGFVEPIGEITIEESPVMLYGVGEYLEYDDAVESFREQLMAFNSQCVVYLETNERLTKEFLQRFYNDAIAHNGNPKCGDYIRYQSSYQLVARGYAQGGTSYLQLVADVDFFTTPEQEAVVDAEVKKLVEELGLKDKNPYEKIEEIYLYMTKNIRYDYEHLNDDSYDLKHSAYAALINKTAVCQGYAVLFYRLALEAGLDARVIAGKGNGEAHAWNIVKIGNHYYNLDTTWDENPLPMSFDWFLLNDDDFKKHKRDKEYLTESFYSQYPMADDSFEEEEFIVDNGLLVAYCGNNSRVSIPSYVTEIGVEAFNGYSMLQEVKIGESVTKIGTNAFRNCKTLSNAELSQSVQTVCRGAFDGCINLGSITFDSPTILIEDDASTLPLGTIIYGHEGSTAQTYAQKYQRTFEVIGGSAHNCTFGDWEKVDSLTHKGTCECGEVLIESHSFDSETHLCVCGHPDPSYYVALGTCGDNLTWKITTADGVLTISGTGAMYDYSTEVSAPWSQYENTIDSVVIEDGVTNIGNYAFKNCSSLRSVTVGSDVTSIGDSAFEFCSSLMSINLPDGVTGIGNGAFMFCSNLTKIDIPDSVKTIDYCAFMSCSSLTSVNIPKSVQSVGNRAFEGCSNIKDITFESSTTEINGDERAIPDRATIYGHNNSTAQAYAEKYQRAFVSLDPAYIKGDVTGDDNVNNSDAIYLLYNVIFGDMYGVNQDCDFDKNGSVNNADAIYLLYHAIFGAEMYPI